LANFWRIAAIALFLVSEAKTFLPSTMPLFYFSFYLFFFFASRPPLGGIDDGAGGFAQGGHAALFGNDVEQWLRNGLEKLWPLGTCAKAARSVADSSSNSGLLSKKILLRCCEKVLFYEIWNLEKKRMNAKQGTIKH
jgi:hypothetical protein